MLIMAKIVQFSFMSHTAWAPEGRSQEAQRAYSYKSGPGYKKMYVILWF